MERNNQSNKFARYLKPIGIWALAFGCSVGWGSFVMPGTTFLPIAGPIGTLIGIIIGAVIMAIIGINYSYLMNKYPDSGGTFTFTKKVFGYDHGFLSSWFMILVYLAIIWANTTALPLIFRSLFGDILQVGYLYTIAGYEVYLGEIILSLSFVGLFGFLCIKGGKLSNIIQIIMSIILIISVVLCFGLIFFRFNSVDTINVEPYFSPNHSSFVGPLFIVFLAPWAFAGFESVSHSTEEYNTPVKKTFSIMTVALLFAATMYILLNFIGSVHTESSYSNWYEYISDLGNNSGIKSIPVFNNINNLIGLPGVIIIAFGALAAILTGLVGNSIAASRLIYSIAKDSLLPNKIGELNNKGVPANAIIILMIACIPIPFLGRSAIGWVVDINTIGVTIAYAYTSAACFKESLKNKNKKTLITGIVGIFISIFFLLYFLIPNKWAISKLATESYLMLLFWILIGFIVFYLMFKKDPYKRIGKSTVVWIVMLLLVFFTSFIWMKETTSTSSKIAIEEIAEVSNEEYIEHGIDQTVDEKEQYIAILTKTFNNVTNSVLMNTLLLLTIIIISLFIIFRIYNNVQLRHQTAVNDKNIAEQSSNAKTTFLSNMSHDIRTPMNAIIGYVTLLKREKGLDESTIDYLNKIEASSQHLLAIINDVLEMSRIESGKMELSPVPTNIINILDDVHDLFLTQMQEKGIDYKVIYDNITVSNIICDANRLNRVLLNLISNAYKFTDKGGKIVVELVEESVDENNVSYKLTVADNGIGMSEEFAAKVFEAYERERSSKVENIQGTGLGTAITKNIVDMMKGTIDVKTKLGEGTTFIINLTFPINKNVTVHSITKNNESDTNSLFNNLRLLLVEDDLANMEVSKSIFEELGFIVDTVKNGEEAVELIAASNPKTYSIVIMDIEMPIKNGYEATKLIRSLKNKELASIPIVAVSAKAFSEDIAQALDSGMNAHIAKPINVQQLKKTLIDILEKKIKS